MVRARRSTVCLTDLLMSLLRGGEGEGEEKRGEKREREREGSVC